MLANKLNYEDTIGVVGVSNSLALNERYNDFVKAKQFFKSKGFKIKFGKYNKTGLITFSGPDFISFGLQNAEEQYKIFEDAFINKKLDKFNNRNKKVIRNGNTSGKIIGTNYGNIRY